MKRRLILTFITIGVFLIGVISVPEAIYGQMGIAEMEVVNNIADVEVELGGDVKETTNFKFCYPSTYDDLDIYEYAVNDIGEIKCVKQNESDIYVGNTINISVVYSDVGTYEDSENKNNTCGILQTESGENETSYVNYKITVDDYSFYQNETVWELDTEDVEKENAKEVKVVILSDPEKAGHYSGSIIFHVEAGTEE